jgi:hypothetical protein
MSSSTRAEPAASTANAKMRRIVLSMVSSKPFRQPVVAVGEKLPPTLHTTQKTKLDRFGFEDPMGFNDIFYQLQDDLVKGPEKPVPTPAKEGVIHTKMYSEENIDVIRAQWFEKYKDILQGVPNKLLPMRDINHQIPLMDDEKHYEYYLPRCPESLKPQLLDKISRYTDNGWWKLQSVTQAAPMLCIPKKDGSLRTAINLRKRNDNTHKDVTPFPDQEQVRHDVARAAFQSKIDMSDAYEQIHIDPKDVWKTAFASIYGTFLSLTMQIGDCNAPATFQKLMTLIFQDCIGGVRTCVLR